MSSFPYVAFEEGGYSDLVTVSGRTNFPESEYAWKLSEDEIVAVEAGEYCIRGTVVKADLLQKNIRGLLEDVNNAIKGMLIIEHLASKLDES